MADRAIDGILAQARKRLEGIQARAGAALDEGARSAPRRGGLWERLSECWPGRIFSIARGWARD